MGCAGLWTDEIATMSILTSKDFGDFFEALWGKRPFAWQMALAEQVLSAASQGRSDESAWPEAIALPTAAGKTACLDIAVFALAAQAARLESGEPISAPRRIFFVVDRRVIVDEAYERARCLAMRLELAQEGILGTVADALRRIAAGGSNHGSTEPPLSVHSLRGGIYRSEAWAKSPLQPTVVATTVDQLGSRLLFRGYGRGPGMWPICAGLVGNDSLILLDEAHCAQPMLQTLTAVARYRRWGHAPLAHAFWPVVLSATPPQELTRCFEDSSAERLDPAHPLGQRQLAHKPATLKVVSRAKGARGTGELSKALVQAAIELVDEQRRAIVIFVNRVATARATHQRLSKKGIATALLTGRMRPIDKDAVITRALRPLAARCSAERDLDRPLVVVATQTLEVGADLDFDGVVSECASLDALRQRFGRLNRMGRAIEARASILIRADQKDNSGGDPVYGAALAYTWAWLNDHRNERGEVDLGIAHLARLLPEGEELVRLNAPAPDAPVMLPAHVDRWAQTSPEPQPSPEVGLFLRGPGQRTTDVQVCWRADLELGGGDGLTNAVECLSLCPPSSSECLAVPIGTLRSWLRSEGTTDESSDVEGLGPAADASSRRPPETGTVEPLRQVVRWRGRTESTILADPDELHPGDVVVVPTSADCWVGLGDVPVDPEQPPSSLDVGDRAHRTARAKGLLRLHPRLIEAWPECDAKSLSTELLRGLPDLLETDPDTLADAARQILQALAKPETPFDDPWAWLTDVAQELAREYPGRKLRSAIHMPAPHTLFIVGRRLIPELAGGADSFGDEDDSSSSGTARRDGRPVTLGDHLPGVEHFARAFAEGCGLDHGLVQALSRAGLLHDLGKADPRFQALLNGGNPWVAGDPLAKSGRMPKTRETYRTAVASSGYPEGGRHELVSVRLAESAPGLLPEDPDHRDLVLHLIASHHGRCRPFAPVVFDDYAPTISFSLRDQALTWSGPTGLESLDSGVAERYWRLTRRYGWWGLAWLESLLRLADHRRSEWEETHEEEDDG
jgi:CRISPR-associated endonuclease/helicase Cas3